jgi:hypothetical protein
MLEFGLAQSAEQLPDMAAKLVRLKVDVIVASGTPSVLPAKNATRTIPIVFVAAIDPDRRRFLLTSLAGAIAVPLAAEAQQAGKVYRVGILGEKASDPSEVRLWQAFRLGLRELGWLEGRNILIESRWAEGNHARIPELAVDLVRLKVDLIVTRVPRTCRVPEERHPRFPSSSQCMRIP